MHTLVGISYSPWTEKARFGLDVAGFSYRYREYLPMVGEPLLRLRAGRLRGRLTVPILLGDGPPISDSFAIVQHACARTGSDLLPARHEATITRWNALSERVLSTGRERTTLRVAQDPVALMESVPGALGKLGPASRALGRLGVRYLMKKYAFQDDANEARVARMGEALTTFRASLAGGDHLLDGRLTYADITMAVALQMVSPPPTTPIGPRSRIHWTVPELVTEFGDLISWRDRLYARFRNSTR
ncbi:MAG: hypothetical protein AMXMBFR64_40760 [Myxococcales bacterium]